MVLLTLAGLVLAVTASDSRTLGGADGACSGHSCAVLHALDLETGSQRWNASLNGSCWASPLAVRRAVPCLPPRPSCSWRRALF